MLLWDSEMQPFRERLFGIRPTRRLVLAVDVMAWTLASMGRIETEEVRDYIADGIKAGRESILAGHENIDLPDEMLKAWGRVDESAEESGTSHVLSALLACSDAPNGLTADVLYGVLSFCYEGLLDRQELPVWTLEAEEGNVKCLEAISFQKNRILELLDHEN